MNEHLFTQPSKSTFLILVLIFALVFTIVITLATEVISRASGPTYPALPGVNSPILSGSTSQLQRTALITPVNATSPAVLPVGENVDIPNWLSYINYYREQAKLPRVVDNPGFLGQGCDLHARYMVKTDRLEHFEDFSNPWFSIEGNSAGQFSDIVASYDPAKSDEFAIDSWMQAPFHALPILNPYLVQVGYSSYREADGGLQMAACLDVFRGLDFQYTPGAATFPIKWPPDGAEVPLNLHFGENPDPLTGCPGYQAPTGLPITLQVGNGNLVPQVENHSFAQSGNPLEHCVFDETTYTNPDVTVQAQVRQLLASQDAVVLIPRAPLIPGTNYNVSMTVNGQTYDWSFNVSNSIHHLID